MLKRKFTYIYSLELAIFIKPCILLGQRACVC